MVIAYPLWKIPTTKINGASPNPMRWPDGTFSIQGVAVELGITSQTVFSTIWLVADFGWLPAGERATSWQIDLSDEQIDRLTVVSRLRRTKLRSGERRHQGKLRLAEDVTPLGEA